MRRVKVIGAAACLLAALTATSAAQGAGGGGQGAARKSLYERLGGLDAITAVTDEFIKMLSADARLNKKLARSDGARVRLHFIEQICMLTGGPCKYTGNGMKKAHHNMGITEAEFKAGVEDLGKALDKFNVGAAERDELFKALARFHDDIVEVRSQETGTPLPASFKPAPALAPERVAAGPAMKGGGKKGGAKDEHKK